MKVHIITASHNRKNITSQFIESLKQQSIYDSIHLILVDDGSTDGTSIMVEDEMPTKATILKGNGNLWWGGAMQMAYKWIMSNHIPSEDIVVFSNDDNTYEPSYIETGVNIILEHPDTLVVGNGFCSKTKERENGVLMFNSKSGEIELLDVTAEGNIAATQSLFLKVKDLKRIGGFHPILLPHYLSDYEFTFRASKKGLKIKAFDNLKFYFNTSSTGAKEHSKLSIKILFSKRCPYNPIYRFIFIFLTTPLLYLPSRVIRQFRNYYKLLPKVREEVI